MEIKLIVGAKYAVSTDSVCRVTYMRDGKEREYTTAYAGQQGYFVAQSSVAYVDDENADVTLFTDAPSVLVLLRGGGKNLPTGYTRLEYLEGDGEQYILTAYDVTPDTGVRIEYEQQPISEGEEARMEEPVGTRGGGYFWFPPRQSKTSGVQNAYYYSLYEVRFTNWERVTAELNFQGSGLLKVQNMQDKPAEQTLKKVQDVTLPPLKLWGSGDYLHMKGRIWYCEISQGQDVVQSFVPVLDKTGTPCMFDTVTRKAFKNEGTKPFVVGMTLNQVRGLRLPAGGGELTLSLPHEASIDRLAQAALERARTNGWKLTLRFAEAEVPAGYRKLAFLEGDGTQYILTDGDVTPDTGVRIEYEQQPISEVEEARMEEPVGTRGGGYFWFPPRQSKTSGVQNAYYYSLYEVRFTNWERVTAELNFQGSGLLKVQNMQDKPAEQTLKKVQDVTLPPLKLWGSGDYLHMKGRIWYCEISQGQDVVQSFVPALAPTGAPCMYDKVTGTMKENAGTGPFIAGLATVEDVCALWLPASGGELTLSIPADTPDGVVDGLRKNYPNWQIAIRYRTDDNEN